jgi:outer membrane protein
LCSYYLLSGEIEMKKSLLVVALLSAFAPMVAQAEAGDIVVRLRTAYVNPDESSKLGSVSAAAGLGGVSASGGLHGLIGSDARLAVGNNTIPELDISYYVTKNIAVELILATGTRHNVNIVSNSAAAPLGGSLGNQALGSVNILPPTLTAQWHFNPDQTIDPYIGAGVNYTHSFDRNLTAMLGSTPLPIHIEQDMFGVVAQAGVDVNLGSGWLINADVKYVTMNTNVKVSADSGATWSKIDDLDINPWVFGVGIGKRF